MVVQSDINSANPGGIHYYNKLHPGMRMARWALAKQYGKKVAYTGPIYKDYEIKGGKIIVSFEKDSLFGGLMVEARAWPRTVGNPACLLSPPNRRPMINLIIFEYAVMIGSGMKRLPIYGVNRFMFGRTKYQNQLESSMHTVVPENSNLYNKAGLPATPFAVVDGEFIFEEDDLEKAAAIKAKYAQWTDPDYPILQVAEYYRDGVILQRNQPIKVWGHANKGVEIKG